MADHDAEMDAILELLEGAGLVQVYVNADGKQAMRLTADGERVSRQMAMSEDPDAGKRRTTRWSMAGTRKVAGVAPVI